MKILGIETSCDDTSAAVVEDGEVILSNIVSSQDDFHSKFSGVVPEIASRKHLETVHFVVQKALDDAGLGFNDIDKIAVTNRPGLIGSLLVGVSAAKAYSYYWKKPIVPVNHMAAHLYTANFNEKLDYPVAGLIISGGHTLLVNALSPVDIEIKGTTIDDAVGEVYDKIAKYFDLGYPGGPIIDRLAAEGDEGSYEFPRTLLDAKENRYNFSFSGIKTSVIHQRKKFYIKGEDENISNIAASYQAAVADVLIEKAKRLLNDTNEKNLAISGGVAANSYLRKRFDDITDFKTIFPPRKYCTDNAAMVAGVAFHSKEVFSHDDIDQFQVESRVVQRGQKK